MISIESSMAWPWCGWTWDEDSYIHAGRVTFREGGDSVLHLHQDCLAGSQTCRC